MGTVVTTKFTDTEGDPYYFEISPVDPDISAIGTVSVNFFTEDGGIPLQVYLTDEDVTNLIAHLKNLLPKTEPASSYIHLSNSLYSDQNGS